MSFATANCVQNCVGFAAVKMLMLPQTLYPRTPLGDFCPPNPLFWTQQTFVEPSTVWSAAFWAVGMKETDIYGQTDNRFAWCVQLGSGRRKNDNQWRHGRRTGPRRLTAATAAHQSTLLSAPDHLFIDRPNDRPDNATYVNDNNIITNLAVTEK